MGAPAAFAAAGCTSENVGSFSHVDRLKWGLNEKIHL